MTLPGSHWIWGYLYDDTGSIVSGATVTASNVTGIDTNTETTTTTATGYYQLNVQDICNDGDLIRVRFEYGRTVVYIDEFIRVKVSDLTQEVSASPKGKFEFTTKSHYIWIKIPNYDDSDMALSKSVRLFNFYDGQIDTVDVGTDSEPLHLTCEIELDVDTRDTASGKIEALHIVSNNDEECTITGINDCINGVFIITHVRAESIPKTTLAFRLIIDLEYVRDD